MNYEKTITYHRQLAQVFKELVGRRKLERNNAKIGRVTAELKRTGKILRKYRMEKTSEH